MTIVTQRYIRKPLYVDAVQVTAENMEEMAAWCQGDVRKTDENDHEFGPEVKYVHVRVHNPRSIRQTRAFPGDWLLYTEKGYKIYTTRAFEASFDPVTNGSP